MWQLTPTKSPDNVFTFGNLVGVSPQDFAPSQDGSDIYLLVNEQFVFTARPHPRLERGQIGLSDPQRTWASISLQDIVHATIYDPFAEQGGQSYLGALDVEVGFAGKKSTDAPYDQDELSNHFVRVSAVLETNRSSVF
jgi:vesicle-fusing ATPase